MTRLSLERYQVWIYVTALTIGATLGLSAPGLGPGLEALIWPALAILLYAAFSQVPLVHLRQALSHGRFLSAVLTANFIFVPALVWLLTRSLPPDPAILLGVFMVLLVPCTDWFIAFTHLGRGETRLAMAATPVMLLAQIVLLPLYLGLFMGARFMDLVSTGPFLQAFLGLIVLPLCLALVTEKWTGRHRSGVRWLAFLGWLPVPFLALVLLLIAASQVSALGEWLQRPESVISVVAVFVAYLIAAAYLGRYCAWLFGLSTGAGRALVFSVGTRNSFVVLPFALALPPGWEAAVVVIVVQSLVELIGMMVYLWWVPTRLLSGDGEAAPSGGE